MMPGHPHHIVVPGDDPQGILLVPVNWVFFSEAAIIGIGVSDNVLGKHIIVDRSKSHNPFLPRQQCVTQRFPRSNPRIRRGFYRLIDGILTIFSMESILIIYVHVSNGIPEPMVLPPVPLDHPRLS